MITATTVDGFTILTGNDPEKDWVIVPFWPCSGRIVRKMAPDKLSRDFVDEAVSFADAEYALAQG